MKTKISLLVLVVLLVLALVPTPTQADASRFAFYRPYITSETGLALYNTPDYINFPAAAFDTKQDGLYVIQPDGQFTTAYVGVVKVTGSCVQSKASLVGVRLVIDGYSYPLRVAETSDEVFTFSAPIIAGNVRIQAMIFEAGRYDLLKCDVVFEAVG